MSGFVSSGWTTVTVVEKPAGSRASISGVKVKKGTALKLSGTMTTIGASR